MERVTSLKVLGVTLTDRLSVTALHTWMTSSARVRGLCTPSAYCGPKVWRRQLCSRCSVRSSSLSSLITPLRRGGALRPPPTDSVSNVLRRAVRSDLWTSSGKSDAHTFEDLCNSADDELFTKIRTSSNHILHALFHHITELRS